MKNSLYFLIIIVILILIGGCDSPTEFDRNNPSDPSSTAYIPEPPSNITISFSKNIVSISWKDTSLAEDGYLLEKSIGDSLHFQSIAMLPPNTTQYQDSTKDIVPTIWYRVSSFSNKGSIIAHHINKSIKLDSAYCFPAIPKSLSLAYTRNIVQISWIDSSQNEDGCTIEKAIDDSTLFNTLSVLAPYSQGYTDTTNEISANTWYRIKTHAIVGNQVVNRYSNPVKVDVGSIVSFSWELTGDKHIHLSWNETSYFEDSIRVLVVTPPNTNYTVLHQLTADARVYTDTTADLFFKRRYRLELLRNRLSGLQVLTEGELNCWLGLVCSPTSFSNTILNENAVRLTWVDNSNFEEAFEIQRSIDDPISLSTIAMLPANTVVYTDTSTLRDGMSYYYGMRAKKGNTFSGQGIISFTYSIPAPILDGGIVETNPNKVILGWQHNTDLAAQYYIEQSINGNAYQLVATLQANNFYDPANHKFVGHYEITVDTANTYKFRVRSASSKYSNEISIAYVQNYALCAEIQIIASDINDVIFSPNNQYAATAHDDGTAKLWDVSTGSLVQTFSRCSNKIYAISFSPTGDTLATASFDGSVILWNTATGTQCKILLPSSNESILGTTDVEFSPSGHYVGAITGFGKTTIMNLKNNTNNVSFGDSPYGCAQSISFSYDEKNILMTGYSTVKAIDIATRQPLREFNIYCYCYDVQWSQQGEYVLVNEGYSSSFERFALINLRTNEVKWTNSRSRSRFDKSGTRIIYNGQILDIVSKQVIASACQNQSLPGLFAISNDGNIIANTFYSGCKFYKLSGKAWKGLF